MGAALESFAIGIDFGIFKLETTWKEDPAQRHAAWELYVELVTRIAVQELDLDGGLVREALSSLKELFGVTRGILREAGPKVGRDGDTVGGIAITVVNSALRPFLTKWHPALLAWEGEANGKNARDHERDWLHELECRAALKQLQAGLIKYAAVLAKISGA